MKCRFFTCLFLLLGIFPATVFRSSAQCSIYNYASDTMAFGGQVVGQSFVAGCYGTVTRVSIDLNTTYAAGPLTMQLRSGAGCSGTLLASTTINPISGFSWQNFSFPVPPELLLLSSIPFFSPPLIQLRILGLLRKRPIPTLAGAPILRRHAAIIQPWT